MSVRGLAAGPRGGWAGLAFWLGLGLALWFCLPARAPAASAGPVLELRAAQVQVSEQGRTAPGRVVQLPYHWDRLHSNRDGRAVFELSFAMPAPADQPHALFFPLIGNAAQVWLNGRPLARYGDLDKAHWDDYGKVGRLVAVSPALLQAHNVLRIEIRADGGRRGGLSPFYLGPTDAVLAQHAARTATWRESGSLFLGAFSLVVGAIALLCWVTQRELTPDGRLRRDRLYLWAGLAELCWSVRVFDALIVSPPLPWPLWGVVMTAAYAGWICGVLLFCHHAAGWHRHRSMPLMKAWAALLFGGAILCSALSFALHRPVLLTGWLGFATASAALYSLGFAIATVRAPSRTRWLLAAAGVLNVLVGVRDWVVIRLSQDLGNFTWNRYVSVIFGLALLYIVLQRFQRASGQARELLGTLQARVAEREKELASTYGRLEGVAREQARTHERERILRDMHDGVGAHLSAAIRQLQSGQSNPDEVLRTLRDSMDQLKLSIDAMQLPPGDVEGMLAALRYRLEPRLAGAGIHLAWAVDELPPCAHIDAQAMRQLQFLLFEAISNVLQHAHASSLRLEASTDPSGVWIRVIDDGQGFDAARVPQSLRARAEGLGAQLDVRSRPGRTEVALRL